MVHGKVAGVHLFINVPQHARIDPQQSKLSQVTVSYILDTLQLPWPLRPPNKAFATTSPNSAGLEA